MLQKASIRFALAYLPEPVVVRDSDSSPVTESIRPRSRCHAGLAWQFGHVGGKNLSRELSLCPQRNPDFGCYSGSIFPLE